MAKFVKCHAEGEEFLVNLDLVVAAISKEGHAKLLFQDDTAQEVDERVYPPKTHSSFFIKTIPVTYKGETCYL